MSYRHFTDRLTPAVVRASFLAELAVRNKLLGHGDIFTYGVPKSRLSESLPAHTGSTTSSIPI